MQPLSVKSCSRLSLTDSAWAAQSPPKVVSDDQNSLFTTYSFLANSYQHSAAMSFLPSAARSSLARSLARTVAPRVLPRAVAIAPPARRLAGPSFSTSSIVRGSGTTDSELSARLAQELAYEQEVAGSQTHSESAEPDFLRDFKSTSIWSIKDEPGSDEIALEREFGNEKIRVLFSIGDIDSSETEGYEADEDANEPEKNETDEDEGDGPAFPVRCAISIAKVSRSTTILTKMRTLSRL